MKICKVSRASLIIYIFVFFIMLLFEAQRLNAILEREGANHTVFLKIEQALQVVGEKSGIYALSNCLHDEFNYVAEHSLFSTAQNFLPTVLNAIQKNSVISSIVQSETSKNLQAESNSSAELSKQTLNNLTPERPKTSKQETTIIQDQTTLSNEIQNIKQTKTYLLNQYGYPFDKKLMENSTSAYALPIYHTVMPDFGKKKTVLLIGDSMMMEGLGPTLHHRLRKRDNLDVYREGKYSSGLSRPDFYDWPVNLVAMLKKYQPDLLIISLGANDTQDIVIDKKRYFIDTKEWSEIYLQRSKDFLTLADNGKRHILWVSLPVMGKEPYFTRTKCISKLQAEASNAVERSDFINIEHLLTENGKYTTFYKDKNNQSIRLRSQDLIHVSTAGGEILTDYILPHVDKKLVALYADDVPQSYPPVAGFANRVIFYSKLRQKETEYFIWLPQTQTPTKAISTPLNIQQSIQNQLDNKRYPVLYLLHGATGSGKDFVENMGKELQKIADTNKAIIVAPSCEPYGWYLNSPLIAENQIADYITKELLPHIDSLYPTNGKRAITGLSMGGHGALLLGFNNKNLFQSMAGISAVMDIRDHKNSWKIKKLLGVYEENSKIWNKNSVYSLLAEKWPATSPSKIFITVGTEDKLVINENRKIKELFHKRGFKIDYQETQGSHNWNFWQTHIPPILIKQTNYLNSL